MSLDEEEKITVVDVAGRARVAFDVDKITKKFYDRFKAEHVAFLKLVKGIKADADLQWYTSLMLNRLMFVYFIQKKGFLDGDTDYLRNRLETVSQARGKDQFQSFYRYFLLRLFQEGLGKSPDERKLDPAMERLLGKVPYLNGGFFEVHQLEEQNPDLDIPDKAFEKLFDFFDQYSWHLDERPLRADNEINPDVVGYIFEKYINQKQMGAYYTKEDITEYISKNTIIPFLFDAAQKKCIVAFTPDSALWRLLRDDPDRYIYAAVRHGVIDEKGNIIPLSTDIEVGIKDVAKRDGWNRPASGPYALPTETWREHVARRQRCLEIREKLRKGEVHQINDLITLNLDIWQFARDAIVNAEGPELLRAFWHAIEKVTILDPTCGSGAFLFAALRILETLYSDCMERMERFIEDLADKPHHPEQYSDFKKVLAQIAKHPNERYFVLKSIIINNLFGVDIMEEAVEICKLRLFLKLVAQVEAVNQIEPLPDIDFNIRAGNTLVGYATEDQARKAFMEGDKGQGKLMLGDRADAFKRFEESVEIVERAFHQFRAQQTTHGGNVTHMDKQELRNRLANLDIELDRYLAGEYGVNVERQKDFEAWKASHQPFHWFVEFYGIMHAGGFDVIIGNPPYVEYKQVSGVYTIRGFRTVECGNLYAYVVERSLYLTEAAGRVGLIVPISVTAAQRMVPLQKLLLFSTSILHLSSFALRPAALFPGVMQRLTICIGAKGEADRAYTTDYITWYAEERPALFDTMRFNLLTGIEQSYSLPKLNNPVARSAFNKIVSKTRAWSSHREFEGSYCIYYHNAGGYWIKTFDFKPYYRSLVDASKKHTTISELRMKTSDLVQTYLSILNSNLFYFFWKSLTDARHVYPSDIAMFPIGLPLPDDQVKRLHHLNQRLMSSLKKNCARITYGRAEVDQYSVGPCKPIIDEIDRVLAKHYCFTDEELDFIINYDIKYRMGQEEQGEGEE